MSPTELITSLDTASINGLQKHLAIQDSIGFAIAKYDAVTYLGSLSSEKYSNALKTTSISADVYTTSGWELFKHKIPLWIFLLSCLLLSYLSFNHNYSLIPLLGLVCCLYMMSELGISNWIGFGIWLLIGLVIYFSYSRKKSKLNIQ